MSRRFKSTHDRHAYVHHHHFRLKLLRFVYGFTPIGGLGDDLEASLALKESADLMPHFFVVLGN